MQALDDNGVPFVFALCIPCRLRLDRLPASARMRQHAIAIRHIAENPPAYALRQFDLEIEARIFTVLVTERDPQTALMLFD